MNQKDITTLIKNVSGQANFIGAPRLYIDLFEGDIVTAIWFNQVVYWDGKTKSPHGFYKTDEEWRDELGISPAQRRRAQELCEKKGLITVEFRKAYGTPKNHYKVVWDALLSCINSNLNKVEPQESEGSEPQESEGSMEPQQSEGSINREENTTESKTAAATQDRPEMFTTYEQEVGIITPGIARELQMLESQYPQGWLPDAFKIASERNRRSLSYIRGILSRWKTEGRGDVNKPAENAPEYKPAEVDPEEDNRMSFEEYQQWLKQQTK